MRGRADLYVGFYEKGLKLLRPEGQLAFICADRWMRNQYGGHLRQLVKEQLGLELIIHMHDVDAFEAASPPTHRSPSSETVNSCSLGSSKLTPPSTKQQARASFSGWEGSKQSTSRVPIVQSRQPSRMVPGPWALAIRGRPASLS